MKNKLIGTLALIGLIICWIYLLYQSYKMFYPFMDLYLIFLVIIHSPILASIFNDKPKKEKNKSISTET